MSSKIMLPKPDNETRLGRLLKERRSVRSYKESSLTLQELSRLLWFTYGCVEPDCERRTSPSAGATYPFEVYVSVRNNGVEDVEPGIYHYDAERNELVEVLKGDFSRQLAKACLGQRWVLNAPVNIILVAVAERTTGYYGERGWRYIFNEAGHIGQNIYLASVEMGLGTVAVGAFNDDQVSKLLNLPEGYEPVYVFPVGRVK
ncbi:MAG: SagB/ThcOx family dehydrogenase [Thermosphaera aggregans]|jgi:SagB-type dehydrogenase family enzyme|uniref:SagB/ThcOx family dehydrogenase n=1 Tax=Thermosphaera aggregans TaxID=54254 RepID=UPI003C00DC8A